MEIKQKGEWKYVPIEARFVSEKSFSGFGSMKVLTNYELIGPNQKQKSTSQRQELQKKKAISEKSANPVKGKQPKINSPKTQPSKDNQSAGGTENELGKKSKKKRKPRKKKPKSVETAAVEESTDNACGKKEDNAASVTKGKKKRKAKKKKSVDQKAEEGNVVSESSSKPVSKAQKRKQDQGSNYSENLPKNKKRKKTAVKNDHQVLEKAKEEADLPKKKSPDMSRWKDLFVPDPVLAALKDAGFDTPTPIQCLSLPPAIRDMKDILGAAETGSGKTLSFGIPMIHNILEYRKAAEQGITDSDHDSDSESDFEDEYQEDPEIMNEEDNEEGKEEGLEEGTDEDEQAGEEEDESEGQEGEEEEGEVYEEREVKLVDVDEDEEGEDGLELEEEELSSEECELDLKDGLQTYDLDDGELGCVTAIDNVKFDWLEEDEASDRMAQKAAADAKKPLLGMVLTPTRELAIQVRNHLQLACSHTDIKVCAIVGGMAPQKQERLLKKCPEIIVATPGRFWELLEEGNPHLAKVTKVKTLVFDEADRMVEKGHFDEVKRFIEFMNMNSTTKRQNFIYSATLTLVHDTPNRLKNRKRVQKMTSDQKLGALMELIGIDKKAKVIDLTRKVGTAETLVESKINCSKEEKDVYLHYFLQQYPGRTLVFTNSKDCLRRLVSVLTVLNTTPLPLHADMHQSQRLKNLDRFRADPKGLLIATDVAARGLDIPDVQHVIHYQVPRTSENYVHRSGRTARASKEGLSIMLVGPDDLSNYRRIIKTLNRDEDLGTFPVESDVLAIAKSRVSLAVKIDKAEHTNTKKKKENLWFERAAKEMDIELDEDALLNDLGDSHEQAVVRQRIASMRRELKYQLAQPIIPKGFSGKYPTRTGKLMDLAKESDVGACAAVRSEASKSRQFKVPKIKRLNKSKIKGRKGKKKKQ